MVELPPIKTANKKVNTKKNNKKKLIPIFIESKIFENGATWFDLDTTTDVYNLSWHRYIPLHKQTEEYINSKKELSDKRILLPLISDFDENKVTKFREEEIPNVKGNVYARLSDIKRKENALKEEWICLENDELDFSRTVEIYNKFVITNAMKREISNRKIQYYRKRSLELDTKIVEMRCENIKLREIIVKMKENIAKHMMYYDFCADAAYAEGSYTPIFLINRFLAIKEAEEFVLDRNQTILSNLAIVCDNLKTLRDDRKNTIQSLRLQFNEQKQLYEEAYAKACKSQRFYNSVREMCLVLLIQSFRSVQGISTVYECIRSGKNDDTTYIPRANPAERLVHISRTIEKLEKIKARTQQMIEEEKRLKLEEKIGSDVNKEESSSQDSSKSSKDVVEEQNTENNTEVEERVESSKKTLFQKIEHFWDQESKRTTFKSSLASFRSMSSRDSSHSAVSSSRWKDVKQNFEYTKHTVRSDVKTVKPKPRIEMSSYQKRKLYDQKRKSIEKKRVAESNATGGKRRKNRPIRSGGKNLDSMSRIEQCIRRGRFDVSANSLQTLNNPRSDQVDFGEGKKQLKSSKRNSRNSRV